MARDYTLEEMAKDYKQTRGDVRDCGHTGGDSLRHASRVHCLYKASSPFGTIDFWGLRATQQVQPIISLIVLHKVSLSPLSQYSKVLVPNTPCFYTRTGLLFCLIAFFLLFPSVFGGKLWAALDKPPTVQRVNFIICARLSFSSQVQKWSIACLIFTFNLLVVVLDPFSSCVFFFLLFFFLCSCWTYNTCCQKDDRQHR